MPRLLDFLWQALTDLIMAARAPAFRSPAAIGVYLFPSRLVVEPSGAHLSPLAVRCHGRMNCVELSPEIGETTSEAGSCAGLSRWEVISI